MFMLRCKQCKSKINLLNRTNHEIEDSGTDLFENYAVCTKCGARWYLQTTLRMIDKPLITLDIFTEHANPA